MPRVTESCCPFHRRLACSTDPYRKVFLNRVRLEDRIVELDPENSTLETDLSFPESSNEPYRCVEPSASVVKVGAYVRELFLVPASTRCKQESTTAEVVNRRELFGNDDGIAHRGDE